jgi:hypothetical protein
MAISQNDLLVLNNLTTNLRKLSALLLDEPYYPAYQRFLRRCFAAHAQRLGWDAKPEEDTFAANLRYRATHAPPHTHTMTRMFGHVQGDGTV